MSDDTPNPALLPAGLRDLLPPDAETEAAAVEALMDVFAAHGYQRVKPPLIEFEDSLLAGSGAAVAEQTFRLMDPDSQRMMGLRADTTPQVARIATTRLAAAPRPLRLAYAGQCLRVRGSQIAPTARCPGRHRADRRDSPVADAEIVLVGAEALASVGLTRLSFDLLLPTLVPVLLDDAGITGPARAALARALDRKDAAAVAARGGALAADADRAAAGRRTGRPGAGRIGIGAPAGAARDLAAGSRRRRGGDSRPGAGPAPDHRPAGISRSALSHRGLGHDLRARAARGTRQRRSLHLRRGGARDRADALP